MHTSTRYSTVFIIFLKKLKLKPVYMSYVYNPINHSTILNSCSSCFSVLSIGTHCLLLQCPVKFQPFDSMATYKQHNSLLIDPFSSCPALLPLLPLLDCGLLLLYGDHSQQWAKTFQNLLQ